MLGRYFSTASYSQYLYKLSCNTALSITDEILETMKKHGLEGTRVLSRQAGQEMLTVLKFSKSSNLASLENCS